MLPSVGVDKGSGVFVIRRSVVLIALLAALSVLSATAISAQTGVSVDTDGEATVSAVETAGGVSTATTSFGLPPFAAVWPYTCTWDGWLPYGIYERVSVPTPGQYYHLRCTHDTNPALDIDDPNYLYGTPTNLVTSSDLALVAMATLTPPALSVGLSPDPLNADQITGVESWLWPEGSFDAGFATAETATLASSVTAEHLYTTFNMGDGTTFDCVGQEKWTPGAGSTSCSHTYLEEGTYTVTATSYWQYYWNDNAQQPLFFPIEDGIRDFVEVLDIEVVDLEALISR